MILKSASHGANDQQMTNNIIEPPGYGALNLKPDMDESLASKRVKQLRISA